MINLKTFVPAFLLAGIVLLSTACASKPKSSAPLLWISGNQVYKMKSTKRAWEELELALSLLPDEETVHQFGAVEPDGDWSLVIEYQDGTDLMRHAKTAQSILSSNPDLRDATVYLWHPAVEIGRVRQTRALPARKVEYARSVFNSADKVAWLENYAVIPELREKHYRVATIDSAKAEKLGINLAKEQAGIDAFLADRKNNVLNFHTYKLKGKKGQKISLIAVADIEERKEIVFQDGSNTGFLSGVYFANPEEAEQARTELRKFYEESVTTLEEEFDFEADPPFSFEEVRQPQLWAMIFVPKNRKQSPDLEQYFQGFSSAYQLPGNHFLHKDQQGTACFVQSQPETNSSEFSSQLEERLKKSGHEGVVEVLNFHPWKYFPPLVVPE